MTDPKSTETRRRRFFLNFRDEQNVRRDLSEKYCRKRRAFMRCDDEIDAALLTRRKAALMMSSIIDGIEEFFGSAEPKKTKVVWITNPVFEKVGTDPEPWCPEHDPDYDIECEVTHRRSHPQTRARRPHRGPSVAGIMIQRSAVPLS